MNKHPRITIYMKDGKNMCFELLPEYAPASVSGFLKMVQMHAYDEMKISRIVPDFVWQPWYDENSMPQSYHYIMEAETTQNGFEQNTLPLKRYTLALAGDGARYSSPSCFFIVAGDHCEEKLNGRFAGIGRMISGMDSFEQLMNVPLKAMPSPAQGVMINEPIDQQVIQTIDVDLAGFQPVNCEQFLPYDAKNS